MYVRIIPRLDIKGPNLVKGIHLEGLRVLGKPESFAKFYYDNGADELLYMDVVASLYGRNSLTKIIEKTAKEIFIPLTVGGGLRTIRDIREALLAGADKVSLNTAAIKNPNIIKEAAHAFGSSTIVVSIEVIQVSNGKWEAFIENGREETGKDAIEWAKTVEELGAGEIMVTSVDREGTGKGFDIEITKKISNAVEIPVIACGGPSTNQHVVDVLKQTSVSAVSIASLFHYNFISKHFQNNEYNDEGNIEYLKNLQKNGLKNTKFQNTSIAELKEELLKNNILTRK